MANILYPALAVLVAVLVFALVLKDGRALAAKLAEALLFWGIGICLWLLSSRTFHFPP